MNLLFAFLIALAGAFIVLTIAVTVMAYPSLPAKIPTRYGLDGSGGQLLPRAVGALIMPAIALVLAVQMALTAQASPKFGLIAAVTFGVIFAVQSLLLNGGRSGSVSPQTVRRFTVGIVCCVGVLIALLAVLK